MQRTGKEKYTLELVLSTGETIGWKGVSAIADGVDKQVENIIHHLGKGLLVKVDFGEGFGWTYVNPAHVVAIKVKVV